MSEATSKIHLIVSFMAMLELIKNRTVKVYQEGIFQDIFIMPGAVEGYELQDETAQIATAAEMLN